MSAGRFSHLYLLDPDFRAQVEAVQRQLETSGIPLRVFESIRSPGRQASLYGRGRDPAATDFGRTVTRARAWQSAHQYGLAVDFVFWVDGEWTWDPPKAGDWEVFQGIARAEGLTTLDFEKPHVQAPDFQARLRGIGGSKLEHGPDQEAGWLQWLRVRNG